MTRDCKGFKPDNWLITTKNENGDDVCYLPAYARLRWYDIYQEEKHIRMPLKVKPILNENGMVVVEATISEVSYVNGELEEVVIATEVGSCPIEGYNFPYERAATRAKGRVLKTAGFSFAYEMPDADELEDEVVDAPTPAFKPDLVKPSEEEIGAAETEAKPKKKRGRPKKTASTDTTVNQSANDEAQSAKIAPKDDDEVQISFNAAQADVFPDGNSVKYDTPPITSFAQLFPPIVEDEVKEDKVKFDEKSDEDKLRFCLNECFYPWNQRDFSQGDLTRDIALNPKFVEKLQWILKEYSGDAEITDGVTILQWANTLGRYLINSTPEDKTTLLEVLQENN